MTQVWSTAAVFDGQKDNQRDDERRIRPSLGKLGRLVQTN